MKGCLKWIVYGIGGIFVLGIIGAILSPNDSGGTDSRQPDVQSNSIAERAAPTQVFEAATVPPEPTATVPPEPPATSAPEPTRTPNTPDSSKQDGFYTVGAEIIPGSWESDGTGSSCYWARLDNQQEIHDNHLGLAGGTMTIRPDDFEVQMRGCGTWHYIGDGMAQPQATIGEPKSDGFYTVGVEISSGIWESDGTGSGCYWARLDNQQEIRDNHLGLAGGTMTIRPDDYEVQIRDCGTWRNVGNAAANPLPSIAEPKSDGFYTVGVEISPGVWSADGNGDRCYWARLDNQQEIQDNHLGLAGGTMTIQLDDYEVQMRDCGTWTLTN